MNTCLNAISSLVILQIFLKTVVSFPTQDSFALTGGHDDDDGDPSRLKEKGYNPYLGRKVLDNKGRCILEWLGNHTTKIITFNITCTTTGWVGLGFSKNGKMKKADLIIGGVRDGKSYIGDMHSDYSRKLMSDATQDWTLISASEINGVTFIQVTRPFDTCDPHDYPITTDLLWVIWAFGETDDVGYHFHKRGSFRVYLLDPIIRTQEKHLKLWKLRNTVTLLGQRTTYVCTIHRAPILTKKHSIVEMHAYMENEVAVQHTHHIVLFRCVAPPGFPVDLIFQAWTLHPGEECYFGRLRVMALPTLLCKIALPPWGVGGEPLKLPQSVGYPLGESLVEYYLLEMHYNNPLGYSGVTFTSGLNIYYTDKPRPNDAGALLVFSDPFGLFMVPPISTDFEVYGYCTPNCTNAMIPKSGVYIVAVGLHGHLSATKIRLQHSRNGMPLDVMMKDDNYDPIFQQYRILYEPRLLLPDDQLVVSCVHDNTWTNTTTVNGFATYEEMCMVALIISELVPYFICASQIPQKTLLPLIGVEEVKWNMDTQKREITKPARLAGKPLEHVTDKLIEWDESLRHQIQEVTMNGQQIGMCPQVVAPGQFITFEDMKGTIITFDVTQETFLTMIRGYGIETFLGLLQVPTRTPGPISKPIQEGVKYHHPPRSCPKVHSPFTATAPVGNSFDGRAVVGRAAMPYVHYWQPFSQYIYRKY